MGDITQTVIAETIIYGRRETKFVEGRANSTQIKLIIPVRFICVSAENTTVTLEKLLIFSFARTDALAKPSSLS